MLRVHSYESMGTFDGPGLRLVVFLQGCNFRCLYCANPDTIDPKGESKETSVDEIARMAMSQRPFFGKKGGVTFSGGEPTFQAKDLVPMVKRLKELGIHVCIDTNGGIWNEHVEELLGLVDLVLLDVKQFNPEKHLGLTERKNEQTLKTAEWLEKNGKRKSFRNFKQFVKLYPEHKAELERFIKTNQLFIDNVEHVKALCVFAESL